MFFVASRLPADEFFVNAQLGAGFTCGPIYSPEEIMQNEHTVARGFPVTLHHEDINRDVINPGAPFIMTKSPWRLARAPHLGEHQHLLDTLPT